MCCFAQNQPLHGMSRSRETRSSNVGWTSGTVNVNMCRFEKDTRNESSLRKFVNVHDLQVPEEDDRVAAQPPPHDQSEQQDREKTNLRGKQSLANKIVTKQV